MGRRTPTVRDGTLHQHTGAAPSYDRIAVESADWFAWLESHHSFRVESPNGPFLARKEQRAGGWYWYAYRRHAGRLSTAYLGRSAELSATRLHVVAETLAGPRIPHIVTASFSAQQAHVTTSRPAPPRDMPRQLTSLVGRAQYVEAVKALLLRPEVRLVSLIGTAGVGKTRLAIQVATDLQERFAAGVFFVALAAVRDPEQVPATIAQTLGLSVRGSQSALERLKIALREQQCFLILDNFEQLIGAAPQLADLLAACPDVKLLVTSREVLHLRAEQQFNVAPLVLPADQQVSDVQALAGVAAVDLFIQRAQAISPAFQMTPHNAAAIAAICRRLDGLPLAIELAAARIQVFSPQALLARLDQRLLVLTDGACDLPERQQTLRATIAWSYALLPPEEQRLFQRFAAFADGCQLAAAEALCGDVGEEATTVLAGITALIDKSLLHRVGQDEDEPRLAMLETIREFAVERLMATEAWEATCAAHARYYLQLAEAAQPELAASRQERVWLERLHRDEANLWATLHWLLAQGEHGGSMEPALRMGAALESFWLPHGFGHEEVRYMQRALQGRADAAPTVQAKALFCAGHLAYSMNDLAGTVTIAQELDALCRDHDDKRGRARALYLLGSVALIQHNVTEAMRCYEAALALRREVSDSIGIAWSLMDMANAARATGAYTRAQVYLDESFAHFHQSHHAFGQARVLDILGQLMFEQGQFTQARDLFLESYTLFQQLGIKRGLWNCAYFLGRVALYQGEVSVARRYGEESQARYREYAGEDDPWSLWLLVRAAAAQEDDMTLATVLERLLTIGREKHDLQCIYWSLDAGARRATAQGNAAWAVRLWGMAEVLRETASTQAAPVELAPSRSIAALPGATLHTTAIMMSEQAAYDRAVAVALQQLGSPAFTAILAEGRSLSLEHVLATRTLFPALMAPPASAESSTVGLTAREREVLRLLAQGLTSAQMAEHLVIGLVTINSHIRAIYSKLRVTSRSAATRYAVEHHLI